VPVFFLIMTLPPINGKRHCVGQSSVHLLSIHYYRFLVTHGAIVSEANVVKLGINIIIINVKINMALSENASRTWYTIKIKLKLGVSVM